MPKIVGYDESVTKRATCRGCGAINAYAPNEVRELWRGKDYSGCYDGAYGITCAGCGKNVETKSW